MRAGIRHKQELIQSITRINKCNSVILEQTRMPRTKFNFAVIRRLSCQDMLNPQPLMVRSDWIR